MFEASRTKIWIDESTNGGKIVSYNNKPINK